MEMEQNVASPHDMAYTDGWKTGRKDVIIEIVGAIEFAWDEDEFGKMPKVIENILSDFENGRR